MTFSKQLIFIFLSFFPLLNASEPKHCKGVSCGARNVVVRFPFWLFPKHSSSCGYPRFNLLCTNHQETSLKLPNSEPFIVRELDYKRQRIRLNDPTNCLVRRLLSFDVSESPFSPLHLLNYTFLICPNKEVKSSHYKPIHCLGNSTSSFFAIRFDLVSLMPSSCQILKTLLLPVSSPLAVDLNDQDLWLKWDSPNCKDCEKSRSVCGFVNSTTFQVKCFSPVKYGTKHKLSSWASSSFKSMESLISFLENGLYNFILLILKLLCLALIVLLIVITICVAYVTFSSERLPRQIRRSVARLCARKPRPTCHAESTTIESYKKVKSEENVKLPGRNDITCPICLSEYATNETVGCLLECEHCFHIECIDAWLELRNSCPICRNKLPPRHNIYY